MKKIIFLILLFSLIFIPIKPQNRSLKEIISIEKNREIEKKLQKMGVDFLMEWNNRVYILLGFDELLKLEKENIPYVLETQFFHSYREKKGFIQGSINGDYHSYLELEQDLIALEESYPHLARVVDIGNSVEKRNIYALKISDNVDLDEEEAEVLFIGCHHAREWISVEIPFFLGKYLVENYEINPEVKNLVDQSEIWIIPLLNPDGLEYSIHFYRYWRKNRRDNGNGTFGVDLNRNYGYKWGLDNQGSSPDPSSHVYRGVSPFSEPETQAVQSFFAGKNFQALISYHSYSQIILYPWGYTDIPSAKDDLLEHLAAKMSELIQSINGTVYKYGQAGKEMYIANGDTTDWAFGIYDIPSYTIELPPVDQIYGGFFNAEGDILPIFYENLPAMIYLIDWSIENFKQITHSVDRKKPRSEERIRGRSLRKASLS